MYRLWWDGDAAHDPTSRTFGVLFRPVPVTITLEAAPTSPTALDPVTITGVLGFGLSEQVSSPLTLTIVRRMSSDSSIELPPVTTDPDGTFEFTDMPHGGGWTYEVTFAGDDTHERRTAYKSISVRFLQAQVSVELAAGEIAALGAAVAVRGAGDCPRGAGRL